VLLALSRLHAPVQHPRFVLSLVDAMEGFVVGRRGVEFNYFRQLLFLLFLHHQGDAFDLVELLLVGLELQLETEVGADLRSPAFEQLEGSQEGHVFILDEIGDHQSRRLIYHKNTRETPAPQCTSKFVFLRSA